MPTGYGYVLPDQNGWSRYLHFQAAWAAVLTGLLYVVYRLCSQGICGRTCSRRRRIFRGGRSPIAIAEPSALQAAELSRKPGRITCFSGSLTCS